MRLPAPDVEAFAGDFEGDGVWIDIAADSNPYPAGCVLAVIHVAHTLQAPNGSQEGA